MQQRSLGQDGPVVGALGLGCMGMSGVYGAADDEESIGTVRRALELGITFIDSSDFYGAGHNERLLGRALAGEWRERAVLATKFGYVLDDHGHPTGVSGRPEHVRQACEASLQRLGIDVIDVYFQHRVDRDTPVEETFGAMAELVAEGKVRRLGICEASAETIRRAHATHPLAAVQTEYSLWFRDPEDELLPTCRELGIAYVAYSPLGRGLLSGKIHGPADIPEGDRRAAHPRFQGDALDRNVELVARLEQIADEKGCTLPQLAIAWVLAQGEELVPIPGAKSQAHLEENAQAAEIELSADDLARIDEVAPRGAGAGLRYPELQMKAVLL